MTSTPYPPPISRPHHRSANAWLAWLIRLPLLMIGGSVLLVMILGLYLAAFQIQHADKIYPGVQVLGIDLGGQSPLAAQSAIRDQFQYAQQAVFTFRDGADFWQFSAADLGLQLDVEATVAQAASIGHSENPFTRFGHQAQAWFRGYSLPPVVTYDQQQAIAQLDSIATHINRAPLNASLSLNGLSVQTTPSQTGRVLDIPATLAQLEAQLLNLSQGGEIALVIQEALPLVANVDEAANQLNMALSGPVRLVATDEAGQQLGPWVMSVEQIAALLQVNLLQQPDGSYRYGVDMDMSAFSSFLETLETGLIAPAQNARFHFVESTGQLQVIQPAISGRTLNIPETLLRLREGVFSAGGRIVPVAFDYTLPRLHNQVTAEQLGIRELVAESTTYYQGSGVNRRQNVVLAASKFDGLVIPPGEEFSFNYWLGDIGPESGFLEDKLIFGGRTVLGVGGGVCQVSTTIFRAAFTGGFAITERNSHGYRVGYYELGGAPAGLDAAIWQPERDFRFQNNTPYYLLMEVSVYPNDNALQFRFYSTRHWRAVVDAPIIKNVVAAPPVSYQANPDLKAGEIVQVDYSADGADVTIYRDVYDMQGQLVLEDYVYTHYLPWQAIFEVAPNDPRLRS